MKKIKIYLLAICICTGLISCKTSNPAAITKSEIYRVGFYNVENLFDMEDNPEKADEEYTPEGRNKWTDDRYHKKLQDLGQVLEAMSFPVLIGLCEVENATVLNDFVASPLLKPQGYQYVHYDSPDRRGIDVCLLYKTDQFKVINSEYLRINFPKEIVEDYTTRDILYTHGILNKKDTLHLFINHWPSRRGGVEASEPKRLYVANQLKNKINTISKNNPFAKIIILGDFNDEPDNKSISTILHATSSNDKTSMLVNCAWELDQQGFGTYNYRGNWNMLDQIIVSKALTQKNALHFTSMQILRKDWMIYNDEKYGPKPNRTYGGPNYYGGISDHYPVYIELKRN